MSKKYDKKTPIETKDRLEASMHKIDKVICGLISDLALCLQTKLSNQELSDMAESYIACRKMERS